MTANVFYNTCIPRKVLKCPDTFSCLGDELFQRAKSAEALDEKNRKAIYAELSRIISEEQPVDYLAFQLANAGFQKNVKGIEPGIRMGYNYHQWYFE